MFPSRTAPRLWDYSGRASVLEILRRGLVAAADAITRERRISRNLRPLRSLDDHMLQDIGISRADIEPLARFDCWGQRATGALLRA